MQLIPYVERLKQAGIQNPWKEARLLLATILECEYSDVLLMSDLSLDEDKRILLDRWVQRRCKKEPISKIIGQANFWKLSFITTRATLDPRPESERMIEGVLQYYPDKEQMLSICDLGTGTGCLLLSCLFEYPKAFGVGVDQSESALQIAQKNAERYQMQHRVRWIQSDWCSQVTESFDVVLCNPPYIKAKEILEPDVLFDPKEALFAGEDGLDAYREILKNVKSILKPNAKLFLELGKGQTKEVGNMAQQNSLEICNVLLDFQGICRIMILSSRV